MHPFLIRLTAAVNDHDLDAVTDCFTTDYVNETPAHPARGFTGAEQVRANWSRIFAGVPDVVAEVLRHATVDNEVWAELEMRGTRPDGAPHLMRGVIVFTLAEMQASAARFYLEIVDTNADGVESAISQIVGEPS